MKNIFLNLNEVFLVLTIAEAIVLAFFFKFIPSEQRQPRNFLALYFLIVATILASTLLIWNPYVQSLAIAQQVLIPIILSASLLLQGPALYLYLRSLSAPIKLWSWHNAIHLAPVIFISFVIIYFHISAHDWLPIHWGELAYNQSVRFVWAVVRCYPLVYVIACFYAEYQLRQKLKENYSTISNTELTWANLVLLGSLVSWSWSFVGYFLGAYLSDSMNDTLGIMNNYINTLLVNLVCIFGFINTRRLFMLPQASLEAEVPPDELPNGILDQHKEKISVIEDAIHVKKLYLDGQLNLERFAASVGLKPRDVSAIINTDYRSNFFEFINGYRIEEAKRLLGLPERKDDNIADIISEAGFNSNSAFHRFFKRIVGMTPSQYRANAFKTGRNT